jgi:hypothetical protein
VGGFPLVKVVGYKNVDRLKAKLRQYGAVFMKTAEVFDLPEQVETITKVKATKEYRQFKTGPVSGPGNCRISRRHAAERASLSAAALRPV